MTSATGIWPFLHNAQKTFRRWLHTPKQSLNLLLAGGTTRWSAGPLSESFSYQHISNLLVNSDRSILKIDSKHGLIYSKYFSGVISSERPFRLRLFSTKSRAICTGSLGSSGLISREESSGSPGTTSQWLNDWWQKAWP